MLLEKLTGDGPPVRVVKDIRQQARRRCAVKDKILIVLYGGHGRLWRRGDNPDQAEPPDPTARRCRDLRTAQYGRALLQRVEKRPELCNLRPEDCRQRPRLHPSCLNPAVGA
jgi:hypothetical protein